MRCAKARKLISDHIDGTLEERKILSLERHLDVCPECRDIKKKFHQIVSRAKELDKRSPSEQTWLKIKSKLEAEEQKVLTLKPQKKEWIPGFLSPSRLKVALSAALLLAIIAGGVTIGRRYWKEKVIPGREDLQRYTLAKLDEAERHYQLAIKALGEAVSAQEGSLDPQIARVFKSNLEIIDRSIEACRQTVLKDPDNIEARNYLLAAYRKKVDFLNEMIEIKEFSSPERELEKTL